jgi:hypothetical protein
LPSWFRFFDSELTDWKNPQCGENRFHKFATIAEDMIIPVDKGGDDGYDSNSF